MTDTIGQWLRDVELFFYFPTKAAADAAADDLTRRVLLVEPAVPSEGEWQVRAWGDTSCVDDQQRYQSFERLAMHHGGDLDGYERTAILNDKGREMFNEMFGGMRDEDDDGDA